MPITEYRHGALYVVQDVPDSNDIQRALRKLDDRLFLELQVTFEGDQVWCVNVNVSPDQPPVTILEWRDEKGNPINHLASGIVERVAAMERDGKVLAMRAIKANERFIAENRRRSEEAWREIAQDMVPRIHGKTRPVLHRSQGLRISRDRARARGENV